MIADKTSSHLIQGGLDYLDEIRWLFLFYTSQILWGYDNADSNANEKMMIANFYLKSVIFLFKNITVQLVFFFSREHWEIKKKKKSVSHFFRTQKL